MLTVEFHPAGPEDADALARLRIIAMRPSLEAIGRFDADRARLRFLDTFDPASTWHILTDGRRAGVLVLRHQADGMLLDHLYIDPAFQGQAVGAQALELVFAKARRAGCVVRVGALKGSRSNAFYLRHGFKLTGVGEWDNYYTWSPTGAA